MGSQELRCIAVDMGAGSIRVMLGVLKGNRIAYQEIHRIPNTIVSRVGHDCWDLDTLLEGIRKGISLAVETAGGEIHGIGVDSWGVDYVVKDVDGTLTDPPYAYRDARTGGMQEEWEKRMSREETFRRTGINFYPFNTLFQLLAHVRARSFGSSERLLFIPSYINYLLSGREANELTIASTSQMLSVGGASWDREILMRLGLRAEQLGEVISPGTCLGPVTMKGFEHHRMTSIAVCGHDTASMVAALPAEEEGFAYVVAGTWCIVGIESDKALLDSSALDLGFTNERGYANRYRILKNTTGLWLVQGLRKAVGGNPGYDELERMTLLTPDPPQVIDPDAPEFYNPEDMKQAFADWFRRTGQPVPVELGAFLRCAYNSICFSIRYHLDQLEELSGKEIRLLHVVGGGSRSVFLNQRLADLCGRTVLSGPVEGSVLGNILVQGIALKRISSLEEGRHMVKSSYPGKAYRPEPSSGEAVESAFRRFLEFRKG